MARPSKHNWEEIRKHYEAGKNQAEIVLEFECPKSSLSEKIKSENWIQSEQVKAYIKGSLEVNEQKANLIEQDVRIVEIADNIIDEQTRRKGLIFNATEALMKRTKAIIDKNQTVEKLSCGDGVQNFEPRELNTTDLKNLAETIDKASITLGVNQRHSNQQINIANSNNLQNNISLNDFYAE